jgi:hypothetical protein
MAFRSTIVATCAVLDVPELIAGLLLPFLVQAARRHFFHRRALLQ